MPGSVMCYNGAEGMDGAGMRRHRQPWAPAWIERGLAHPPERPQGSAPPGFKENSHAF